MGRPRLSKEKQDARLRFGMKLRERRKDLGLDLREAARRIAPDFDHTRLGHIEGGRRPVDSFHDLARVYKVPWEALVIEEQGQEALVGDALWASYAGPQADRMEFSVYVTEEHHRELSLFWAYMKLRGKLNEIIDRSMA